MGITVTSMHSGPDFEDDDDHDMNDHDMHFDGGLSLTGHSFGQQHWYLEAFSPFISNLFLVKLLYVQM